MVTNRTVPAAKTSVWLGIGGAAIALLATVANPLIEGQASDKITTFVDETGKYVGFATAFFAVFWFILGRPLQHRKLSRKPWPKPNQVVREVFFSACTQVIFIAVDIWVAFLVPWTEINSYTNISTYGWAYYAAILIAVFVIHDTYFYWMHRALHWPKLYEKLHRLHHESTDPTPYSAFHFHPVEAFLEGMATVALLPLFLLLPWHVSIPVVWGLGQLTLNVIGHLGYEIYPSWWHRVPVLRYKSTAMHHYMHHQMVRGNYGLYFRWWDKLCATEFPQYEGRYDALFEGSGVKQARTAQATSEAST